MQMKNEQQTENTRTHFYTKETLLV